MAKLASDRFAAVYNDLSAYPTIESVAEALGITVTQAKNRAAGIRGNRAQGNDVPDLIMRPVNASGGSVKATPGLVEIEALPDPEEPLEQLVARAIEHNERQLAHAERRKIIDVNLHLEGAFGVVGLPDQHLNNAGTDLRRAFDDAELIQNTEGVYCVAVGDWLDNFIIGRLERERRDDIMTHTDGNRIQEAYLMKIAPKLLAAIGGNHNDWVGSLGGHDLLGELMRRLSKSSIYHADEVRVRINTPSGKSFMHLVRHIFPGHSKYNTAHGVLSWMLDRWQGEDCLWGGHIHSSAHIAIQREFMGESKVVHGMQLATYKVLDGYAVKRGFRKNMPFVAPMIVHNPADGSTTFFEDCRQGAKYLAGLRAGLV